MKFYSRASQQPKVTECAANSVIQNRTRYSVKDLCMPNHDSSEMFGPIKTNGSYKAREEQ